MRSWRRVVGGNSTVFVAITFMRWIFIVTIVCTATSLFAQTPVVSGKVVDRQREPIPFANAALYVAADSTLVTGAVTDINGKFSIAAPAGTYYLEVSFISHTNKTVPKFDLRESRDLGEITLTESAQILDDVIVEGEKSQMELSLDKRVFNVGKDLSNISASAADVLDNVPSVAVDVEGNVSLRGSQNVRILIDGRPSSLTGINTADAMRQLPANIIDRVEVITNPSSRYDAEGEVGIINIILKKDRKTTGSFSLTTGYPNNHGGAFNVNFRKKNFNYFGNYGFNYRSTPGYGTSSQLFNDGDSAFSYLQTTDRIRSQRSHNARLGVDYTLPRGGVLTAASALRLSDGLNKTTNIYEDFNSLGLPTRTVIRNERETEPEHNIEGSLSYRKEYDTKGKLLTADVKWIDNKETENATFDQHDLSIDSLGFQRSMNTENERNVLFQTDYVHPFGEKGKVEAGLKSTLRVIDNDFRVEQLDDETNLWSTIPQLTNHLIYDEKIYAGYAMLGNELKKFSWQVGLRGELSHIDIKLEGVPETNRQRYFNLFPSAHLSFKHARDRTIQLSYSYRLSRPDFRDLMPFSSYSDNRSVSIGNPNLRPEYTHSMEAGYLFDWDEGSILSSAYYRYRTGVVEEISSVDSLAITHRMPVNLSSQDAYGLEFNVTLNPVKWWRFNGNANFYRAITEGSYNDQLFFSDTYTMTSRATMQVTMMKNWNFQGGVNYRAPRITTQGKDLAMYYVDASLSRDILKGAGTITLSVRDLFNTRKFRSVIDREDLGYYSERNFQGRARQLLLTFVYRLNMSGKAKDRDDDDDSPDDDNDEGE